MSDNIVKCKVDLNRLVERLPFGYCVITDAAYMPTEPWVPVYGGASKKHPFCDNFNYYASQVRI